VAILRNQIILKIVYEKGDILALFTLYLP